MSKFNKSNTFPSAASEGSAPEAGAEGGNSVDPTGIPSSAPEGGETTGGKDTSGNLPHLPQTPSAASEGGEYAEFTATRNRMHDGEQGITFDDTPKRAKRTNWVKCQLEAGYLVETPSAAAE